MGFFWWGLRKSLGKLHVMVPKAIHMTDSVSDAGYVMKGLCCDTLTFTIGSVNILS